MRNSNHWTDSLSSHDEFEVDGFGDLATGGSVTPLAKRSVHETPAISFDAYCHAVRDAAVQFVLTRPASTPFELLVAVGKWTITQFGRDGGGSIADGTFRNDAIAILVRREPSPCPIYLNGHVMGPDDIALLAPGSHFIFSSAGPRAWLSISIPVEVVHDFFRSSFRVDAGLVLSQTALIFAGSDRIRNILVAADELRRAAAGSLDNARDPLPDHAERQLLDFCLGALTGRRSEPYKKLGVPNHDALEVVTTALRAVAQERPKMIQVADLCRATGVSSRTLLRAFHSVVEMGPTRYLRLRRLNLIRRDLLQSGAQGTNVTDVLVSNGVDELGRISGQYKALFGELPSETIKLAANAS